MTSTPGPTLAGTSTLARFHEALCEAFRAAGHAEPLGTATNLLLTQAGAREAFLFQWVDVGEDGPNGPRTAAVRLAAQCLGLHQHVDRQGLLVFSRAALADELAALDGRPIDNRRLGELLGYPCPGDLRGDLSANVFAVAPDTGERGTLLGFVCWDTPEVRRMVEATMARLESALVDYDVDVDLELAWRPKMTPARADAIHRKLASGEATLTADELWLVVNALWNASLHLTERLVEDRCRPDSPLPEPLYPWIAVAFAYAQHDPVLACRPLTSAQLQGVHARVAAWERRGLQAAGILVE